MRRQLAAALVMLGLAATAPLLTACNTTAGAGQDLQAAGRGLENSADRNAPYRP
jgi:entericidin B